MKENERNINGKLYDSYNHQIHEPMVMNMVMNHGLFLNRKAESNDS